MYKPKDPSQRLVELETENKYLKHETEAIKRENETLKRENTELRETNSKLAQTLASSQTENASTGSELQRELIRKLSETRKQLLTVQDRLIVSEQVTAATQRRELVQEGLYENLPTTGAYKTLSTTGVYEELRFDPTQEHIYAELQLTTHSG